MLHREALPALEVGGYWLGGVNLIHRASQHVLIKKKEVGILASADTASLILDEHLLGHVDGHGSEKRLS